ncbi:MAG: hypothetical protein ACI9KE_003609 [Polyangiales bacterium]|jgi:hypothetical protein
MMKVTTREAAWLKAIGSAFAPEGDYQDGHLVPKSGEVDYVSTFCTLNAPAGPKVRYGIRAAVALIALSPFWHRRRLATIDALNAEERTALIDELTRHPLQLVRELTLLMKVQSSMALLGTPSLRSRSGYDSARSEGTPIQLRRKVNVKEVA